MSSIRSVILAGILLALVGAPVAAQSRAPVPPRDWPAYTAPLTDPTWRLTSLMPESITPSAQPVPAGVDATLAFDMGVGVGMGGCNGFIAPVTFTEPDGIAFDHVAPTLAVCEGPGGAFETGYFALLPQVTRWAVTGDALGLFDAAGSQILGYTVIPVPSLAGTWNVIGLLGPDGTQIDLTPMAPVIITFADGQVSTTVGCNGVGGGYTQDGAAFSFAAGPATQMYCDGLMDAETALRAALSDAVTVRSPGGVMNLVDAAGYSRLILSPTHDPNASPEVSPAG
jgi:heat shock protein HslJ